MIKEIYFDYDRENDSLFIFKKDTVRGSVDVGNYVVDFTHEGNVAGIEIINASEVLKNLSVENPGEFLEKIKQVSFKSVQKRDSVVIYFAISSSTQISSSIAIPVAGRKL